MNYPMPENPTVLNLLPLLVLALGAAPLNKHAGCWEHQIDESWRVAINGHREAHDVEGVSLPPFHIYLEYNGWPAGILHPLTGGLMAAGEAANEGTLIAALVRAIERANGNSKR